MKKVIVLLSTYNGQKYLKEQLDSLVNQTLKPYKILIRDDGSTDETIQIINEYKERYDYIDFYSGENLKPAKSFFDLINKCENADYYALCDQDDVWFLDKLESAINMLEEKDNSIPLLYAGRFILTDKDLNPIPSKVSELYGYSDFAHSLVYHTSPGCTMVFNHEARKQIVKYDINKEYCVIHDAIIHKVVALMGQMILDENPHIYYRQHGNNQIGLTASKFKTLITRITNFTSGRLKNYRSDLAKSLLNVYGNQCDKDKYCLLNMIANYRSDKQAKKQLLSCKDFKVKGVNNLIFKLLVCMNYI